jgi:hypothetical protein
MDDSDKPRREICSPGLSYVAQSGARVIRPPPEL